MRKADFEALERSIWEMNEILAGRMKPGRVTTSEELLGTEIPDVAELRARHKMTLSEFAKALEVSVAKVRDWEMKRREPIGHERIRLQVLDQSPDIVLHPEHYVENARPKRTSATKRYVVRAK
jgi:DNA-binding transcriptional regulator YiaG